VQRRHRDQAETNLEAETQRLRDQLLTLSQGEVDRGERLKTLQRQLEVIRQISQRLSRSAEVLGAAQQELRVSRAVEVMTQHVESLRHLYEREHSELEEARRVLATNNIALHEPSTPTKAGPPGRRRASIAVFSSRPSPHSPQLTPPSPAALLKSSPTALLGKSSPTAALLGKSSPTAALLGNGLTADSAAPQLVRRRRNSAGSGDNDKFGAITEEKEEDHESESRTGEARVAAAGAPGSADDAVSPGDELRAVVEEGVEDELATLRSEQEQLASDLKTLLSRQRDAVLQQTTTVGRLLWDVAHAWPYSREQTLLRARYCFGGLFLLLAVMVLLVPPAYTACEDWRRWHSWAELVSPHLSYRHLSPPPL